MKYETSSRNIADLLNVVLTKESLNFRYVLFASLIPSYFFLHINYIN